MVSTYRSKQSLSASSIEHVKVCSACSLIASTAHLPGESFTDGVAATGRCSAARGVRATRAEAVRPRSQVHTEDAIGWRQPQHARTAQFAVR